MDFKGLHIDFTGLATLVLAVASAYSTWRGAHRVAQRFRDPELKKVATETFKPATPNPPKEP